MLRGLINREIVFLGLALMGSWPAAAAGILVLKSQSSDPYNQALMGFRDAFGSEFTEMNLAGSKSRKSDFVKRMVTDKPRVIVAVGPLAAELAQAEAREIPVVFMMVSNPLRRGLVGDNIAGVTLDIAPAMQFTNYKALLPNLKTLGVIYDPAKTGPFIKEAEVAAEQLGIKLLAIEVDSQRAVAQAFKKLAGKIDALWMVPDETVITPESFKFLLGETTKSNVPFLAASEIFVEVGALAALTPDYKDAGRQGSALVKALEGRSEKPGTLGTLSPAKVNLVLNMKTASKLGLSVPPEVRRAASKVYE